MKGQLIVLVGSMGVVGYFLKNVPLPILIGLATGVICAFVLGVGISLEKEIRSLREEINPTRYGDRMD